MPSHPCPVSSSTSSGSRPSPHPSHPVRSASLASSSPSGTPLLMTRTGCALPTHAGAHARRASRPAAGTTPTPWTPATAVAVQLGPPAPPAPPVSSSPQDAQGDPVVGRAHAPKPSPHLLTTADTALAGTMAYTPPALAPATGSPSAGSLSPRARPSVPQPISPRHERSAFTLDLSARSSHSVLSLDSSSGAGAGDPLPVPGSPAGPAVASPKELSIAEAVQVRATRERRCPALCRPARYTTATASPPPPPPRRRCSRRARSSSASRSTTSPPLTS